MAKTPTPPARPQPPKPQGKPTASAQPARPQPQTVKAPAQSARPQGGVPRPQPTATRPTQAGNGAARPAAQPRPTQAPRLQQAARPVATQPVRESDPMLEQNWDQSQDQFDNLQQDAPGNQHYQDPEPQPQPERPQPRTAPRPQQQQVARAIQQPSGLVGVTDGMRYDQLPDYMREDVNAGKENIESEDLGIVQIKLMQALSPELGDRDDVRAGDFIHTGSGRNLGPAWYGVLVHYQRQFILWNPREAGGGILAQARDGIHWDPPNMEFVVNLDKKDGGHAVTWRTARTVRESGLAAWGTMNPLDSTSPPAATRMLSFLVTPWEFIEEGPAILTFQRKGIKAGRNLLSKIRSQRAPMFGVVYKFSSWDDQNRVGQQFKNMKAEAVGMIKDMPDLYQMFKDMHESFSQTGFDIRDVGDLQDDHTPDDGSQDGHADDQNDEGPYPS